MVHKIIALLFALLLAPAIGYAQSTTQATTGLPSPQLSGTGSPVTQYNCSSNSPFMGLSYIQTDATNGRLWLCDQSSGAWAWDHLLNPVLGVASTGTVTGGAAIAGTCFPSTPVAIAIPGAVVGTNAGSASAVYATAPAGSPGLLNCAAWPSASGVMSAQCCSAGIISIVPNFAIKVIMY